MRGNSMTSLPHINNRSSKRFNTFGLPDKEEKKDKIQELEDKLLIHQHELIKNGELIQNLTNSFTILKDQLQSERLGNDKLNKQRDQLLKNLKKSKEQIIKFKTDIDKNNKNREFGDKIKVQMEKYKTENLSIKIELQKQQQKNKLNLDQIYKLKNKLLILDKESKNKKLMLEEFNSLKKNYEQKCMQLQNVRKNSELIEKSDKQLIKQLNKQLQNCKKNIEKMNKSILSISELEKKLNQAKANVSELKKIILDKDTKFSALNEQFIRKNKQIQECSQSIIKLRKVKQQLQKNFQEKIKQKQGQIENLKKKLQNSQAERVKINIMHKDRQIKLYSLSSEIQKGQKTLLPSLKCSMCKNLIYEPVTIIPCGHCYCLKCKQGYTKQCFVCGPKVKIDAMYRNQLMDDFLTIYKVVLTIKEHLKR